MSGGEAHVENSVWMRAVLIGGVFLTIGILAFGAMGVGVANVKHGTKRNSLSRRSNGRLELQRQRTKKPTKRQKQYDQLRPRTRSKSKIAALKSRGKEKKQIKLQLITRYDAKMDKVTFPT